MSVGTRPYNVEKEQKPTQDSNNIDLTLTSLTASVLTKQFSSHFILRFSG